MGHACRCTFDVWFKGGTSLSKNFRLIARFSQDLDSKIEACRVTDLPLVNDWHRESRRATEQYRAYLAVLPDLLRASPSRWSRPPMGGGARDVRGSD